MCALHAARKERHEEKGGVVLALNDEVIISKERWRWQRQPGENVAHSLHCLGLIEMELFPQFQIAAPPVTVRAVDGEHFSEQILHML